MKNLYFEKINKDFKTLQKCQTQDVSNLIVSYIDSYDAFLFYFKNLDKIGKHHLIISSHFVYGWMPTILTLNLKNYDKVISILNSAKTCKQIDYNEISILKNAINNSLVGASKLLHFINPEIYAIWDSRIFKYLTEKKSTYGIADIDNYIHYLKGLNEIIKNNNFGSLHKEIHEYLNHKTTAMRSIEIIMFLCNKLSINNY